MRPMLAAAAATTAGVAPVFLTSATAVQIGRSLPLGGRHLGIAVAAFFATSALCAAVSGRLTERAGAALVMRAALVPTVLSLGALAAFVRTWPELVGTLAVAGVGNGTIQPAANGYIAGAVGAGRQGLAFGVKQAAIPAAVLLSGLAVPAVALSVGWQWAFAAAAASAVGVAGTLRHPRRRDRPGAAAEDRSRADDSGGGSPGPPATPGRPVPRAQLARPGPELDRQALLVLAAGSACGSAAANALGAFVVLDAVHAGAAPSAAGLIAGIGGAASLVMRLYLGHRADQRGDAQFGVVALAMVVGVAGFVGLAPGVGELLVPAVVVAYGTGWAWAGLLTYAVADTYRSAAARATSRTQSGASVGACIGPLGFGVLVDSLGWSAAWLVAAAVLTLAGALVVVGARLLARPPGTPVPANGE